MPRHWHDRSGKDVVAVELSDEQVTIDAEVVRQFQAIEAAVAENKTPDPVAVKAVHAAIPKLPARRAKHHLAELDRIGVKPPVAEAPKTDKK